MILKKVYRESLALLTDLYELTMAYGYWKKEMAELESVFHLFFRKKPFQGGFAIAAGLDEAIEYVQNFHFDGSDLAYLEGLKGERGEPVFEREFLDYLSHLKFCCDIDAVPEGTPIFPHEPMIRVKGPILQAQLLEPILLNILNFQTLIATKAARVCWAAKPDPVIEFGLRRAQGIDGAIAASRAAYIGGCHGSSNVIAGKLFGIPVKGTHAHSWIMAFPEEEESFEAFAEVMPNNCIFLIDTYDSIQGAKAAVRVAKELRKRGSEMIGVRLDSGDLAHLSVEVRKILDAEGFPQAKIMASNELDEFLIRDMKQQGSAVNYWGVGTNLVTGKDQPALDGVYKLSAVADASGKLVPKLKISEQTIKSTNPGVLQVKRFFDESGYLADMIYNEMAPLPKKLSLVDVFDSANSKEIKGSMQSDDLLVPIFRRGKLVYKSPALLEIRERTYHELARFPETLRRFLNPPQYFVGLEKGLFDLKMELMDEIKRKIDKQKR